MKKTICLCALVFLSTVSAWASDSRRQGFVVGVGIGGSFTSYGHERTDSYGGPLTVFGDTVIDNETGRIIKQDYPYESSSMGLSTDFTLGYAFTNRFILAYDNRVSWFLIRDVDYDFGISTIDTDCLTVAGVSSLSLSFYFQETAPSIYLIGGAGLSSWDVPFVGDHKSSVGPGMFAGIGYEYSSHWSVELTGMMGFPERAGGLYKTSFYSVQLGVKALAY